MTKFSSNTTGIRIPFSLILNFLLSLTSISSTLYSILQARTAAECKETCRQVEERMSFLQKEKLISNRQVMSAMGWKSGKP